jgi:hypothetical protein
MTDATQTRWFDFGSDADLQLRMVRGVRVLRLSFTKPPLKEALNSIYAAGWRRHVLEDGLYSDTVFDHFEDVTSLSGVSQKLLAFFPSEKINAALKGNISPQTKLEVVRETSDDVTMRILAALQPGTPIGLIDHIKSSIAAAHVITSEKIAAAKETPLQANGHELYAKLAAFVGEEEALNIYGHVIAGINQQSSDWQAMARHFIDAAESGNIKAFADVKEVGLMAQTIRNAVRFYSCVSDHKFEGFSPSLSQLGLYAITSTQQRVGYRIYDGAHFDASASDDLGLHQLSAHQGVSKDVSVDARHRLASCLKACGRAFNMSTDAMFADMPIKFFLATNVMHREEAVSGLARKVKHNVRDGGQPVELRSVTFSLKSPGAVVHELGHQMHYSGDVETISSFISNHPYAQQSRHIIDQLRSDGFFNDQYAEYLMHPSEIYARAFEALVYKTQGERAAGGVLMLSYSPPFSPEGDQLESFCGQVREAILSSRREAAHVIAPAFTSVAAMG